MKVFVAVLVVDCESAGQRFLEGGIVLSAPLAQSLSHSGELFANHWVVRLYQSCGLQILQRQFVVFVVVVGADYGYQPRLTYSTNMICS